MNTNSNTFRLTTEQSILINILNTMYNDNLSQIDNITNMLNNLYDTNNQIRNAFRILNAQNDTTAFRNHTNFIRNFYGRNGHHYNRVNLNSNITSNRNTNNRNINNSSRNNRHPYSIETVLEYTIPLSSNRNIEHFSELLNNFLQPVEIFPTQSQIENATRQVMYCDISRPLNTQCPISMENFNDNDNVTVIRHCGHIFHTEHLMSWFRSNCRCPVCRYDIREYNSNTSTEFVNNSSTSNSGSLETIINSTTPPRQTTQNDLNEQAFDLINNILNRNFSNVDVSGNQINSSFPNNSFFSLLNDFSRLHRNA